jgi:circadian clock protein KaiC
LPSGRTTLVLGGPGSGKTVFALQTLVSGALAGQAGIFVSFDSRPRQLVEDGATFGWDLAMLEKEKLIFLDARVRPELVKAGHFDLTGMLAGLRAVATELGATSIVFDSFDVLLTMLDDRLAELQEVFRLRDWLHDNQFTAIITANLDGHEARAAQRQAFMQFISDCTVSLDFQPEEQGAARHLRVVKYRGSGYIENEFPFVIRGSGIELLAPRASGRTRSSRLPSGLRSEIEMAKQQLNARVQALGRFLEMKQAELDFLQEHKSSRPRVQAGRRSSGRLAGTAARNRAQ